MKAFKNDLAFIVEDDDMYSMMLDHVLSVDCTCRFVRFRTGEECLKNLHRNPFLILLDYALPGIDGLKTIQEIKKRSPDIPVVVLTSKNDVTVARKFFNAGADNYLVKQKDSIHHVVRMINMLLNGYGQYTDMTENENDTVFRKLLLAILILSVIAASLFFFSGS